MHTPPETMSARPELGARMMNWRSVGGAATVSRRNQNTGFRDSHGIANSNSDPNLVVLAKSREGAYKFEHKFDHLFLLSAVVCLQCWYQKPLKALASLLLCALAPLLLLNDSLLCQRILSKHTTIGRAVLLQCSSNSDRKREREREAQP